MKEGRTWVVERFDGKFCETYGIFYKKDDPIIHTIAIVPQHIWPIQMQQNYYILQKYLIQIFAKCKERKMIY